MISRKLTSPKNSARKASACLAVAIGSILLNWHPGAVAYSLQRSRGNVVLGRELDISVMVSVDPKEETPAAGCFTADVSYGDTRVSAQKIILTTARTSPTEVSLRVRANGMINEPFVSLSVRGACGPAVSRRYDLLTDSPADASSSAQAPLVLGAAEAIGSSGFGRLPPLPGSFGADVASKRQARDARRAALRGNSSAGNTNAGDAVNTSSAPLSPEALAKAQERRADNLQARMVAKTERKNSFAPGQPSPVGKPGGSRLQVDLLDFSPANDPKLRASSEMLSQVAIDPAARAQAAAMWRAINSSPEDLLRDGERLKAIEADVRTMSELTKQQTKELASLRTNLAKAQSERYANPLVYALGALTIGSLAFAAWAWRRRRVDSARAPWWGSVSRQVDDLDSLHAAIEAKTNKKSANAYQSADMDFAPPSASVPLESSATANSHDVSGAFASPPAPFLSSRKTKGPVQLYGKSASAHRTAELIAPASMSPSSTSPSSTSPSSMPPAYASHPVDFGHSTIGAPRMVNAEELFDIQQQADFFMSLGQHSQAIDILQNHISDNVGTSALAYLDLFDIYHKIGQREDFNALRDEFNRVFNAQVPEFDSYGANSRGLEDYDSAMQRIQALWPTAKVLAVIEESIFRRPDLDAKPFDLVAYRELMLLYALAKDLLSQDDPTDELQVDFDLPPGVVEDFSGLSDMPNDNLAAAQNANSFSPTKMQPLSGAVRTPVVTSADHNVDIDIDVFGSSPDVAKSAAKSAGKPAATGVSGNTINFEVIERTNFSRSKSSKL